MSCKPPQGDGKSLIFHVMEILRRLKIFFFFFLKSPQKSQELWKMPQQQCVQEALHMGKRDI